MPSITWNASDAKSPLTATGIKHENTAVTPVILRTGLESQYSNIVRNEGVTAMTQDQFQREKNYQITHSITKSMLQKGLITDQEYKKIDAIMLEKYRPLLGSLCY